jgi:hypothetical protein
MSVSFLNITFRPSLELTLQINSHYLRALLSGLGSLNAEALPAFC